MIELEDKGRCLWGRVLCSL